MSFPSHRAALEHQDKDPMFYDRVESYRSVGEPAAMNVDDCFNRHQSIEKAVHGFIHPWTESQRMMFFS